MLSALDVALDLEQRGLGPSIGVPCSFLEPLINCLIDRGLGRYLAANNEGEAIAIAAGAYLAGRTPVVLFQNSGLGNAVNPLTSLAHVCRIPVLIIASWRGEPGRPDEPQHRLMGSITEHMFGLMDIPHACLSQEPEEVRACLDTATRHLETRQTPYALIVRKDTFAPYRLRSDVSPRAAALGCEAPVERDSGERVRRREALQAIVASVDEAALLIATTGKTARELCEYHDRDTNFYVVGSMGCASSIALGLALGRPDRRVVILDGDGAALMRLEAMASIGHYAPANLTHVILDNEAYESTGGQQTLSPTVNFPSLAVACGYRTASSSQTTGRLGERLSEGGSTAGPHLVHFRVTTGSDPKLMRPGLAPSVMAARFRAAVASPGVRSGDRVAWRAALS